MMKKIKIMFILLLSCSLNMIGMEEKTILPTYDQQAAGKEAFPPMSQDELLQWKEAVDNEVMKFVESLPEDEQAQFWKDVEEMEQVMQNMSEDELTQFLEDIFVPVEAVAQPELIKEEAPVQVAPEEKKETKPVVEEKVEDINKAIKMLSNIITRTERFLRKLDRIPDISGKIEQWVAKDKIKEWGIDVTWPTLKHDINILDGNVHKIKESLDPKTKQHRYVSDLIKQEALYNNLGKLSSTLTKYEPLVEAPELSTTKQANVTVSKEVRDAIREILGAFAETIYTLDVNKELTTLIEKYEPRAKEHREEEEKAEKRAHEEAKKPRTPSPKKEAAAPKGPKGYTPTGGGEFYEPYYGGYTPAPYEGMYEYPAYPYEQPMFEEVGMGGAPAGKPAGGGKAGRGKAAAHEADEETFEEKGGGKGGKEEGKKPEGKKEEKFVESAEAKHNLRSLEKAADNIEQALENKAFKNMAAFMAPAPGMLVDKDLVEDIAMVTRNMNKAIDAIKAFKLAMKTFNAPQKERYGKEFKTILGAFKSPVKKLAEQVEPIILGKAGYSADKRYAYFNDESVKKDALVLDPDLLNKVKKAANIEDLGKALVDFANATYEPKKK
ncbi:MAG TPA: hypothetical protein VFF04_04880 [Candidatus Babeliales bacterium]|nr:hypothetical protein [Candidatus Babeliales bacterium]